MEETEDLVTGSVEVARPVTLAAGLAACLLSLIGLFGNFLTILALARNRRLRVQATNIFVISLAVSDLLFCSINLPLTAVRYFQQSWTLGPSLCKLYPFFFYGNYGASLVNMVAIAINRYILIAHFGIYRRIYTSLNIALMVAGVWLFSFGWLLPPLLSVWGTMAEDRRTFTCTIQKDARGRSPKMFLFVLGFSLPCLAIIFCYSAIFYRIRASRAAVESSSSPLPSSLKNGTMVRAQQREDLQLTKTMMTIFIVFLVTYLPNMLANLLDQSLTLPTLHTMASVLAWTSTALNPIIYTVFNKQYKQAFKAAICSDMRCCSGGDTDSQLTREQVKLKAFHSLAISENIGIQNVDLRSKCGGPSSGSGLVETEDTDTITTDESS